MTTAKRIVVTQASVEAALAAWMEERKAIEQEHRDDPGLIERTRQAIYTKPSNTYAQELAPFVFSLLDKFGEGSPT